RIIIAVIIMIVGLYVAELIVDQIKKVLAKGPIGEKFKEMDQKVKSSGFSIYDFLFIFVKVFILLLFVQVALSILAISVLSTFITPVILFMPLLLTALAIIFIGLIVADYVVKVLEGLLKEMEFNKLVDPVEAIVKRQGIIMKTLSWVVQALVVLVFVQIAVGVLNSTGAFNALATLINSVILWIPSLIVAILIGLLGFWVATWAHDKVLAMGKDMDIPLYSMIAKIIQLSIIYMAITMALAQAGIEVPMLYLVFALAVGAIMIGIGVGIAYGSKDIFHNVIGNLQTSQTLKVGQRVKIEEYEGTIEEIGRYQLTLNTPTGKLKIPHSKVSKAVILTKD
ncbi:MAG: mechanosensitive ion channel, partial [Thermoplasmata archaeon]|nr:mechanosensitive ion channel [Thermoplasmata archaeon]